MDTEKNTECQVTNVHVVHIVGEQKVFLVKTFEISDTLLEKHYGSISMYVTGGMSDLRYSSIMVTTDCPDRFRDINTPADFMKIWRHARYSKTIGNAELNRYYADLVYYNELLAEDNFSKEKISKHIPVPKFAGENTIVVDKYLRVHFLFEGTKVGEYTFTRAMIGCPVNGFSDLNNSRFELSYMGETQPEYSHAISKCLSPQEIAEKLYLRMLDLRKKWMALRFSILDGRSDDFGVVHVSVSD